MSKVQQLAVIAGLSCGVLAAQGVRVEGSDPVTIGRVGTGIAFGRSLEAAGLNPALLVTLQDPTVAHLALGAELQAQSATPLNNQLRTFSDDRNRSLTAFGFAQRLAPNLAWGLKLDQPFARHLELRATGTSRFLGDQISLDSHRAEAQLGWSPAGRPEWSFGFGLGLTRLAFELGSMVRADIPVDPSQPVSSGNPVQGLAEVGLREKGSKVVPSWSLGARWALASRWTLAATVEAPLKGAMDLSAGFKSSYLRTYDNDGFSVAALGTDARAQALVAGSSVKAGQGDLSLPARATVGVRQRVNQLFTWELDVTWMGAGLRVPTFASMITPSGAVQAPAALPSGKASTTAKLGGEFTLGKAWTLRLGLSLDSGYRAAGDVEPLLGGASQSAFSVGAGYRVWGGELSAGYQYRLDRDTDRLGLDGTWSASGFRSVATKTRVEGAGHLLAVGFRRSF